MITVYDHYAALLTKRFRKQATPFDLNEIADYERRHPPGWCVHCRNRPVRSPFQPDVVAHVPEECDQNPAAVKPAAKKNGKKSK